MQPAPSNTNADTFTGEETFAAPPQRVFDALTDLDADGPLAKSIPDLVSAECRDERTLNCKVKSGFSFLRATMKLTIELTEVDPDARSTAMRITSSGIGASMKIGCRMKVSAVGGDAAGARVAWEANVQERRGLLAAVSPTLIRGAADRVVRDGWESMRRNIEKS